MACSCSDGSRGPVHQAAARSAHTLPTRHVTPRRHPHETRSKVTSSSFLPVGQHIPRSCRTHVDGIQHKILLIYTLVKCFTPQCVEDRRQARREMSHFRRRRRPRERFRPPPTAANTVGRHPTRANNRARVRVAVRGSCLLYRHGPRVPPFSAGILAPKSVIPNGRLRFTARSAVQ